MIPRLARFLAVFAIALAALLLTARAQQQVVQPSGTITAERYDEDDQAAARRITAIFDQIDGLSGVEVNVREGVATLSGTVANNTAAERAAALAARYDSLVAVEDRMERTLSIAENVNPVVDQFSTTFKTAARAWPIYAIALGSFLAISLAGHLAASFRWFWMLISPNSFTSALLAQTVRIIAIITGLLVALRVLDATAFTGAVIGGAGLIGLAVSFAMRDTVENYLASILLSVRQPFRPDEHVVINDREGIVVRLTSRATILMTLDGNHLRIPNSVVFKGIILNYTRNPRRRFEFQLGIDVEDDPAAAGGVGIAALYELPFILKEPEALATLENVGDSSLILTFRAWIDQRNTDFIKARSAAINATKQALEAHDFTLPEPVYRVNLRIPDAGIGAGMAAPTQHSLRRSAEEKPETTTPIDVSPDDDIRRQAAADRAAPGLPDLLNKRQPVE